MSLGLTSNSTMLSGIRKFCDYHFISQFFFECIIDMLTSLVSTKITIHDHDSYQNLHK